jgi:hypothetical protein
LISGEIRVAETGQLGFYFDSVFLRGGIGGDPGWEIKYIPAEDGLGDFLIYSDPETSNSSLEDATFSVSEFFDALKEGLVAYAERYPRHQQIVSKQLARLPAYRNGLFKNNP